MNKRCKRNHRSKRDKGGHCCVCERLRKRQAYQTPEGKADRKRRNYLQNYGLNTFDVKALEDKQKGRCAICDQVKPLWVDHDHKTGIVRALLCHYCNNNALPVVENTPHLIKAAQEYLNFHRSEEE